MRLPRDISGHRFAVALKELGYIPTCQKGDHVRLTTEQNGERRLSIPLHESLRVGTSANILKDVEAHFELTRDEFLQRLSI